MVFAKTQSVSNRISGRDHYIKQFVIMKVSWLSISSWSKLLLENLGLQKNLEYGWQMVSFAFGKRNLRAGLTIVWICLMSKQKESQRKVKSDERKKEKDIDQISSTTSGSTKPEEACV